MSTALREDALRTSGDGLELAVGLPWIRSLPLACVLSVRVDLDGAPLGGLQPVIDGRPVVLAEESGWWFLQDRLLLTAPVPVAAGEHDVRLVLELLVPYLSGGPDRPLIVPIDLTARLQSRITA